MTDLNVNIPLSSTRAGYDPERARARYLQNQELLREKYNYEKMIGKRKQTGEKKLKSLKPEHKQYVSAYINGMTGVEIAEQFNVSAITVYRVLGDPLARQMIEQFDANFKDEFKRMFPLVADAIRESLEAPGLNTKLKAVDRWTKVCKMIDGIDEDGGKHKAEEVLAARVRFVQTLKELTDGKDVIEGEVSMETRT